MDIHMSSGESKKRKHFSKKKVKFSTSSSSSSRGLAASAPGPELKAVDVSGVNYPINAVGQIILLNGSIPGAQSYQRIGRRFSMKSVTLRWQFAYNQPSAAAQPYDYARVILLYDRQPNGGTPVIADVLQDVTNAGGLSTFPYSNLNINNTKRFRVLRDMSRGFNDADLKTPTTDTVQDFQPSTGKWFVNLRNLVTEFNAGTAGTVADINTGALFLLILGVNAAANSQYQLNMISRVRFSDL